MYTRRRTGLPNPSRETKFSSANVDREILIFPVQLTTCRIGNLTRLIHTLAICVTWYTLKLTKNRPIRLLLPLPPPNFCPAITRLPSTPKKQLQHTPNSDSPHVVPNASPRESPHRTSPSTPFLLETTSKNCLGHRPWPPLDAPRHRPFHLGGPAPRLHGGEDPTGCTVPGSLGRPDLYVNDGGKPVFFLTF